MTGTHGQNYTKTLNKQSQPTLTAQLLWALALKELRRNKMDIILKIVQIGFYITGASVAILTYMKAKNGLLNTVNTEYQKRVMDRLAELSVELFDEFDSESENFWAKEDSVKEVLDRVHEDVTSHKHEIITQGMDISGIPIPKKISKLGASLSQIKSDPFIPSDIRNKIVSLIEGRVAAMHGAYHAEVEKYQEGLKAGKYWDTLETNHHWLHNKIIDHLRQSGFGITELEGKVHNIRSDIQAYFEGFNPIKKG
jgi:cobalamin biosynthesis Mg chelatase CobN